MDINELQGLLSTLRTPGALSDMADVNQMVQAGNGQIRNQALGSGLIGAGAGLLGYDKRLGPAAGLGSALEGFNKSYDTEMIANRPKVTPLADGAFSQITFPDGTVQIVGNKDVAKFLEAKYGSQAANKLVNTVVGAQAGVDAANQKDVNKQNLELAGGPQASQEFRPEVTAQIEKLKGIEQWISNGADKVGGYNLPGVSEAIDRTSGRLFGSDDYAKRRDLDQFIGLSVMDQAAAMKGALSDKDVAFLKSIQPKSDDPTENKLRYIQEFKARLQKGEEERVMAAKAAGTRSSSSSGTASIPTSSIPGLSSGAAKYFQ